MSELGDNLDALVTALQAVAATRTITRAYKDFAERPQADLEAGVFTILSKGVESYQTVVGRAASYGLHQVLIVGQVKVADNAAGSAVDEAEFGLLEDLQALANAVLPEPLGGFLLLRFTQSQQVEFPYGWIAAECTIGP